jgi:hypothetical protein
MDAEPLGQASPSVDRHVIQHANQLSEPPADQDIGPQEESDAAFAQRLLAADDSMRAAAYEYGGRSDDDSEGAQEEVDEEDDEDDASQGDDSDEEEEHEVQKGQDGHDASVQHCDRFPPPPLHKAFKGFVLEANALGSSLPTEPQVLSRLRVLWHDEAAEHRKRHDEICATARELHWTKTRLLRHLSDNDFRHASIIRLIQHSIRTQSAITSRCGVTATLASPHAPYAPTSSTLKDLVRPRPPHRDAKDSGMFDYTVMGGPVRFASADMAFDPTGNMTTELLRTARGESRKAPSEGAASAAT